MEMDANTSKSPINSPLTPSKSVSRLATSKVTVPGHDANGTTQTQVSEQANGDDAVDIVHDSPPKRKQKHKVMCVQQMGPARARSA